MLEGVNFAYRSFSSSGSRKESFQNFFLSKGAAASFNRLRDDLARDQGAWTLKLTVPIKQALDPIVDSHNRWSKRAPLDLNGEFVFWCQRLLSTLSHSKHLGCSTSRNHSLPANDHQADRSTSITQEISRKCDEEELN